MTVVWYTILCWLLIFILHFMHLIILLVKLLGLSFFLFSYCQSVHVLWFTSLRPGQNVCYFAEDILKCIFLDESV